MKKLIILFSFFLISINSNNNKKHLNTNRPFLKNKNLLVYLKVTALIVFIVVIIKTIIKGIEKAQENREKKDKIKKSRNKFFNQLISGSNNLSNYKDELKQEDLLMHNVINTLKLLIEEKYNKNNFPEYLLNFINAQMAFIEKYSRDIEYKKKIKQIGERNSCQIAMNNFGIFEGLGDLENFSLEFKNAYCNYLNEKISTWLQQILNPLIISEFVTNDFFTINKNEKQEFKELKNIIEKTVEDQKDLKIYIEDCNIGNIRARLNKIFKEVTISAEYDQAILNRLEKINYLKLLLDVENTKQVEKKELKMLKYCTEVIEEIRFSLLLLLSNNNDGKKIIARSEIKQKKNEEEEEQQIRCSFNNQIDLFKNEFTELNKKLLNFNQNNYVQLLNFHLEHDYLFRMINEYQRDLPSEEKEQKLFKVCLAYHYYPYDKKNIEQIDIDILAKYNCSVKIIAESNDVFEALRTPEALRKAIDYEKKEKLYLVQEKSRIEFNKIYSNYLKKKSN